MSLYKDLATGYPLGALDTVPFLLSAPNRDEIDAALEPLILSASGWRKVFAQSGEEEDKRADIGSANTVLAAHMASVFADWLISLGSGIAEVVVGYDTRPTGPAIADAMCRVFIAKGLSVTFLGTAAAPEIMAYAKAHGSFAYISASHNPIGHNGVKFGLSDGGVLGGKDAAALIENFRKRMASADAVDSAFALLSACPAAQLTAVWENRAARKAEAT